MPAAIALKRLEAQILVPATGPRLKAARAFGSEFGFSTGQHSEVLVRGTVLPSESPEYYMHFTVRADDSGGESDLYIRAEFLQQPESPPPRALVTLRGKGLTAEFVQKRIAELLAKKSKKRSYALVEAELLAATWKPPPSIAAPLVHERTALQRVGVEYEGTSSLRRLRWREEGSEVRIWLQFIDELGKETANLWQWAATKCDELLRDVR